MKEHHSRRKAGVPPADRPEDGATAAAAEPAAEPVPVAPDQAQARGAQALEEQQPSAEPRAEPCRCDQTQCPRCRSWGCPSVNGSKWTPRGRRRHRKCSSCGWVFETLQPHGGAERVVL